MKKIFAIISAFAVISVLTACDIITGDPRVMPDVEIDTTKVVQKFLLEDFTGYMCGNCPSAHDIAKQIESAYQGRVIVMAVHAGGYAEPYSKYPYDFRTGAGNTIDQFFNCSRSGLPNGLINRMRINDSYIIRPNAWATVISDRLSHEPALEIKLNGSINIADKRINAKIDLKYLKESTSSDFICLFILENKIIQFQKDYRKTPQDILDYEHNHVLRAAITPTWGEQLSDNSISIGTKFTKEYNFVIPNNADWNLENLELVAFVYSKDKQNEILQVENLKIK